MKTHWLYGKGPDKVVEFKKEIDVESDCSKCIHVEVCDRKMERRCTNYTFGTSQYQDCQSCLHKYTRFDNDEKNKIPCFTCKWFEPKK